MDIEGYAKRGLRKGDADLLEKLASRILEVKDISEDSARKLAEAVIAEARATLDVKDDIIASQPCGVTMGAFGVGSRGRGDFYAHRKIAEVIGKTGAVCDSSQMDDSGVVKAGGQYVVVTVDGMHSRLSDFPFLAGFHCTRASLRDLYVMGAKPVALFSDIHVADDGDVSKIFDYTAGITTVSDLMGVPLVTGSTLRIGGDMVIGDRMTGCVGAVGVASQLTARVQSRPGDVIMVSEGAGGGTVSTTALYFGMHEVVEKTLNVKFLEACEALFEHGLIGKIHAMTDVTNGGIRGDAYEIAETAGVKLLFYEERLRRLVEPSVLKMLDTLSIDYLGVSLDALLIIAPRENADVIMKAIRDRGVKIDIVGEVKEGSGAYLVEDGVEKDFTPKFRESAYTPVKKVVGEETPMSFEEMKEKVDRAALHAIQKKERMIARIRGRQQR
ncbi:AIR synthase-related protein [Methanocella conradii]|uniref:AIR synthase-related protein n=1 Tax=Methanocella conradii TaxID=1175444 RepID=UPI0024B35D87|nr:AIR synthase-related protein [Methanocella conradii]MDI6896399.1 AIR synthase-related protein [Methanocella conradii]